MMDTVSPSTPPMTTGPSSAPRFTSPAYRAPTKAILTPEQLIWFQSSNTYRDVVNFVNRLNESVIGVKLGDTVPASLGIEKILSILDEVERVAKETPPVDNEASRFGNPAFRMFYDRVRELASSLHGRIPNFPPEAVEEVSMYFDESWGNRTRIDYGSGMELNFLCWLICLERLGVIKETDYAAIVINVFWRYIQVMRVLQSMYWLEPAGSHGVWGLDDYHFLPFLWGAAQLKGHKYIRPKAIHDAEIVEEYAKHYMYFACIKFINSIKTASLRWHSPMLDDISAVKTWDKVNSGMIKMYHAEVLGKLPVVQHFLFGSILPYEGPAPLSSHGHFSNMPNASPIIGIDTSRDDDVHAGHAHTLPSGIRGDIGWGDCCGIPIPSAFAAKREEGRQPAVKLGASGVQGIRPVPFD